MQFFIAIIMLFAASPLLAQNPLYEPNCYPTPNLTSVEALYPGRESIAPTTNLQRRTGGAVFAEGKRIVFQGSVLDANCLPIAGAVVEIWHPDAEGFYKALPDTEESDDKIETELSEDTHFVGAGRAVADNLGRFNFLTIFPGSGSDLEAPSINLRIRYRDNEPLFTRAYFKGHRRNALDPTLANLPSDERPMVLSKRMPYVIDGDDVYDIKLTYPMQRKNVRY